MLRFAADLLNQINDTCRPVIITQHGEPRAVFQNPESYENMRNSTGILKVLSQGEADIKNGEIKSQEEVFKNADFAINKDQSAPSSAGQKILYASMAGHSPVL